MLQASTTTRFYATAIAAVLTTFCVAAPASADFTLNTLGTWGGSVNAVQVEGDLAYLAAGRRLVILNISDPANPLEIGSIDLENLVMDVAVRGEYAFVATTWEPNHFCVVDVSDPGNMAVLWRYTDVGWYRPTWVGLYGVYAYVLNDSNELKIFDVSDPANPLHLGNPFGGQGVAHDIAIVGDLMYMADAFKHVRIYDLSSDPLNPVLRGQVTLPGTDWDGTGIAVEGEYAYATTSRQGGVFGIVDVSDPNAPFVAGYYDDFLNARDVAVLNGFAYVADWEDGASPSGWERIGLKIFDVATDPYNPTLVNTYKTHGSVRGLEIVGTTAYVFDEGEGLILLDLSDPVNPVRLGNYHSPTELRKMAKVGDLLYVTDEWNGFTILDVADPAQPTLVGVYQTPQDGYHMNHWGIDVRDGLAYVAAGFSQLQAVDVADPANPLLVGTGEFIPGYHAIGLELWGDIANVGYGPPSGSDFRFVNFDISDPGNIAHVGDTSSGGPIFTIDTTPEGIAFCAHDAGGGGGLVNVNTSMPGDPFVIYQGQGGVDLARDGNLLYLANAWYDENIGGLYILDVTDPANPIELSHFPARFGSAVAVRGDYAYVVAGDPDNGFIQTLFLLEVSDPTAPVLLTNTVLTNMYPSGDILVDGPYVYVTEYWTEISTGAGLTIFELEGLSPPGDLNGDGCVDQADLGILLADWNCTGGDCPGDADGDGDTDHADLGVLLANWGEGC